MKAVLVFVALVAILSHVTFAKPKECHLELGKEYPEPNEEYSVKTIASLVVQTLNETYAQKKQFVMRDAHPKAHGCVKAVFTVDSNVPEEFRAGIFANASGSYKALIRFSNGQPTVNHDLIPDSRGFAVKLIGVPGKKVMPDESDAVTQDFVGANRPAFFLSTNSDYLQFFENVRRGGLDLLKWLISNFKFREMNAARKFIFTEIGDVLSVQYFSTTPYRLGSGNLAIKYSWLPVDCQTRQEKVDRLPGFDHDFLRERLAESLTQGDNCFDFLVQKQQDACEQPIEDSITEWTTSWTKLGSLVIPKQVLNQTDAGKLYCEDLSFTPWHTLEVHQPLGNINRARKVVYQAASVFRHATNKQKREEPTSW